MLIKSNYIDVLGSEMHYLEAGSGDPILFVHGNPTSSYIWRNIMPYVSETGRAIAVDLIGMGKSDKPPIDYSLEEHIKYFNEFVETLGLKKITLVLHDWGSAVGFNYAMTHTDNVQSIIFMESIIKANENYCDLGEGANMFRELKTEGIGDKKIIDDNFFLNVVLPGGVDRELSDDEFKNYKEPFRKKSDRYPIWKWIQEISVAGKPDGSTRIINGYYDFLQSNPIPKLLLYAKPGALIQDREVEWCERNMPNLESRYIGKGIHFIQEDAPHKIGKEIFKWIQETCNGNGAKKLYNK